MEAFLHRRWPELHVYPYNYPPHPTKALISKVVTGAQLSLIAITVAGDYILSLSPITSPFLSHPLYLQIKENKYVVGIGTWMVGNMIGQSLTSTGAFEVVYKGKVIFSKIEHRRMPSAEEIINPLKILDSVSSSSYSSFPDQDEL